MQVKFKIDARAEEQTVSRSPEMAHTGLLSFCEVLAFIDVYITGGYFSHTDCHETHESDSRIVRLDKDQGACRDFGNVALRIVRAGRIASFRERFGIISTFNQPGLDDSTRDRGMPAVITQCGKKCLIDRAPRQIARRADRYPS